MAIVPTLGLVDRPQSQGYDGYIGNILVRLAVGPQTPLERVTADAEPPRVDTSESGEDVRDEAGKRYSRSILNGGAGLDFLHAPNRPQDATVRYWDSKHINVFDDDPGQPYEARLEHSLEKVQTDTNITSICQIDGTIFYLSGTSIYEVTDPDPPITATARATLSATGIQMVAMGNSLYTLDGTDGVQRYDPLVNWTPTNVTATVFDSIWAAKSRILGVIDNIIYEAAPVVSPVDEVQNIVHDHTGGSFRVGDDDGWSVPVTYNVNAAGLKLAIDSLSSIDSVTVADNATGDWDVTFDNPGNEDVLMLLVDGAELTGGSSISVIEDTKGVSGSISTIIHTLPPADTVAAMLDVGEVVLAFTTTGSVLSLSIDDSLALVVSGEVPFVDEVPIMAAESFGIIGIVTAEATAVGGRVARFYSGAIQGGLLADLQLIYQVGDRDTTEDLTPMAMTATRDSIFTAIKEDGSDEVTFWRYYLPTTGYARAHSLDVGAARTVLDFLEVDDRMWFAVASDGLYRESDNYEATGYLVGPLADFYTADDKQWVGAELTGSPLAVGASLELYDTDDPELITDPDETNWKLVTRLFPGDERRWINSLSGRNARYHGAMVVWRSDASRIATPGLRSYSFRGLPAPTRDTLLRVPLNVSDQIESPGRRATAIPGRGRAIEQALRDLEGDQVLMELYRPAIQLRGVVEKFEETIESITQFGTVHKVMFARVRGARLQEFEAIGRTTSGASLGQDTLGLVTLGLGKVTE